MERSPGGPCVPPCVLASRVPANCPFALHVREGGERNATVIVTQYQVQCSKHLRVSGQKRSQVTHSPNVKHDARNAVYNTRAMPRNSSTHVLVCDTLDATDPLSTEEHKSTLSVDPRQNLRHNSGEQHQKTLLPNKSNPLLLSPARPPLVSAPPLQKTRKMWRLMTREPNRVCSCNRRDPCTGALC